VLLPFLKPAVGSAAVLAFLASFENYNTTVFTILQDKTLTTVLASKVRYGIDPSISALAVLIVALTLIGAFVYEVLRRREQREAQEIEARARAAERLDMQEAKLGESGGETHKSAAQIRAETPPAERGLRLQAHHLAFVLALIAVAGIAKLMLSDDVYAATACKQEIRQEKLQRQQELLERQRELMQQRQQQEQQQKAPRSGDYQSIFDPGNLQGQSGAEQDAPAPDEQAPEGEKDYQSIFEPGNLQGDGGNGAQDAPAPTEEAPAEEKDYQSIFEPQNLQQ
jgi:spermidine/putrescine transport system permease protein